MKLIKHIQLCFGGRCPRCTSKTLFYNLFRLNEDCMNCGLKFSSNESGSWFFLLLIDRALFIFPMVIMIYFELPQQIFIIASILIFSLFIILSSFRLGFCFALDYYLDLKTRSKNWMTWIVFITVLFIAIIKNVFNLLALAFSINNLYL